MSWSEERIERLKALWAEGFSASEIARDIGGVTRNAVISKIHRLGLSGRVKAISRHARRYGPARKRKPRSNGARNVPKLSNEDISQLIRPAEHDVADGGLATRRDNQCCFPIGDPLEPDFGYCREDREIGCYCLSHFLRMSPGVAVKFRPEAVKQDEKAKDVEAV